MGTHKNKCTCSEHINIKVHTSIPTIQAGGQHCLPLPSSSCVDHLCMLAITFTLYGIFNLLKIHVFISKCNFWNTTSLHTGVQSVSTWKEFSIKQDCVLNSSAYLLPTWIIQQSFFLDANTFLLLALSPYGSFKTHISKNEKQLYVDHRTTSTANVCVLKTYHCWPLCLITFALSVCLSVCLSLSLSLSLKSKGWLVSY